MPIHVDDIDDENYKDNPDEIGYGKPPKHSQFKKGQSGNPAGRKKFTTPPKSKNLIEAAFLKPLSITSNGKKIKKPAIEIAIDMVLKRAIAKGDGKALMALANEIGGLRAFLAKQEHEGSEAQMIEIKKLLERANQHFK